MGEIISILMPVYNREKYIAEAITSILQQTYQNIQLIIYDDGSTDSTIDIVKHFKDSRIILILGETNHGVSFSRNQLLNFCETKYAAWQDSDDVSNIHRIQMQYDLIQAEDAIVYTRYRKYSNIVKTNYLLEPRYLKSPHTANASAMFVVQKQTQFNENLPIGEDVEWQHKMVKSIPEKFINYILYYVRFHSDRLSVQFRGLNWEALI